MKLELAELGYSDEIKLTAEEWKGFQNLRYRPSREQVVGRRVLDLTPGRTPGTYRLRANSVVGIVRVGRFQVSISPKCGVKSLAIMLNVGQSPLQLDDALVGAESGNLVEYLARLFVHEVDLLTKDGLAESYLSRRSTANRPRGRIDFGSSRNILPMPVTFFHDDLTSDIDENRLLANALERVVELLGARHIIGSRAASLRDRFASSSISKPAARVYSDSRLPDYSIALQLATTIVDSGGIEPTSGDFFSQGLLFDMPRVYEDFISQTVANWSIKSYRRAYFQGRYKSRYLALSPSLAPVFRLKPDFEIWDALAPLLVGDVKYKDSLTYGHQADMYQVSTYARVTGVRRALVVYAGKFQEEDLQMDLDDGKLLVKILSLDLEEPAEAIVSKLEAALDSLVATGV